MIVRRKPIQHRLYAKFMTVCLFLKPSLYNFLRANMLGIINILNVQDGVEKLFEPRLCENFMTVTFFMKTGLYNFRRSNILGMINIFNFLDGATKKIKP